MSSISPYSINSSFPPMTNQQQQSMHQHQQQQQQHHIHSSLQSHHNHHHLQYSSQSHSQSQQQQNVHLHHGHSHQSTSLHTVYGNETTNATYSGPIHLLSENSVNVTESPSIAISAGATTATSVSSSSSSSTQNLGTSSSSSCILPSSIVDYYTNNPYHQGSTRSHLHAHYNSPVYQENSTNLYRYNTMIPSSSSR